MWRDVGTLALPKALGAFCAESARLRNGSVDADDAARHTPEAALHEYVGGSEKVRTEIKELLPKVREAATMAAAAAMAAAAMPS